MALSHMIAGVDMKAGGEWIQTQTITFDSVDNRTLIHPNLVDDALIYHVCLHSSPLLYPWVHSWLDQLGQRNREWRR